ncbi:MAG: hypothetical protein ABI925_02590 [Verrucomicrobiota bacterium]
MSPSPSNIYFGHLLAGLVASGLAIGSAVAAGPGDLTVRPEPRSAVTQVQCITPDGRISPVSKAAGSNLSAPATIKNDDTISCPLREGETVFIITFSKIALLDRFTFVNENAAACGELQIAVSNAPLKADSPAWTTVDGAVPFARKRLFNLSMLGVEAKYVKLSFRVDNSVAGAKRETPIASLSSSEGLRVGYIGRQIPSTLRD